MPAYFSGASASQLSQPTLDDALTRAFPRPTPAGSWLDYQNVIRVETDSGVVVGRTLPANPIADAAVGPKWDPRARVLPGGVSTGTLFPPATNYTVPGVGAGDRGQAAFHQRRVEPATYIIMSGYALRVGYPVPCPDLADVNGNVLVNCNRTDKGEGFVCWIVGHALYPVFKGLWTIRYLSPDGLFGGDPQVAPNPLA